jgi:hypothetical protein
MGKMKDPLPDFIAAPVKKGTKKHGKVHRQGKRKEARYP